MDIKFIRASSLLGQLDCHDIINIAQSHLVDPVDANILEIALCDKDDSDCLDRALERLFEENDIKDMSISDALNYYASSMCRDIVEGGLSPILGSDKISKVAIASAPDGYVDLDPFIYASSEAESRPEDRRFFENAIMDEAKRFLEKRYLLPS